MDKALIFIWYILGVTGFWYWWTTDHKLDAGSIIFALILAGFTGVLSWVVGAAIHGNIVHTDTYVAVCPYCGHDHQNSFEWGNYGTTLCRSCGKRFEYTVDVQPSWTTRKIENDKE